jgi:uncharacterized repeat protein (TIGR03843 family)
MKDQLEVLSQSIFKPIGQITTASNMALLMQSDNYQNPIKAIFKPTSGLRPLWDFPNNDLIEREFLTYQLSEKSNLNLIPLTIMREIEPFGLGMLQLWIEESKVDLVKLFDADRVENGFLVVLEANDQSGRRVSLGVKDTPWIESLTIFDAVVNNSDRKGSHILTARDGTNWAIDHGVCWHQDYKLRTVNWSKANLPLTKNAIDTLQKIDGALSDMESGIVKLLSRIEFEAAKARVSDLKATGVFPMPPADWPAIPWPVF